MTRPAILEKLENVTDRGDGRGWMARCPAHDDGRPSLKVDIGENDRVLVHCFAGCTAEAIVSAAGGSMEDLFAGSGRSSATLNANGNGSSGRKLTAIYKYISADGSLLFRVMRYEPKAFRQCRPTSGGWVWNLNGVKPVLYRLPELLNDPDADVVFSAGEKDADRLDKLGILATTAPMGEAVGKWHESYTETLTGRSVAILADNDQTGHAYAESVAQALHGHAERVTVVHLPDLPDKGDVSDWLDAGHTKVELLQILKDTPVWTPEPVPEVAAPLDDVHGFLGRFVAYPSIHAHVAHTLWIIHTHLMDDCESTPRIAFLSPEPASGKTRALEITELLVPRPVEAVNVSATYLFRKVGDEAGRPTILFDEIDTVFGPKAREHEETRGLINAGHRKGAVAGRCIVLGKTVKTVEFPAYCAVALAGLGALPDTILSRSVIVRMRRRAANERVEPYRRRVHVAEGHRLGNDIAAWARSIASRVHDAWPEMPDGVEDRDADIWEALLAIADAAGGDWPTLARKAAVTLVAESKASTPSLGIRLLTDLRTVFGESDAMSTDAVLAALQKLDEAPWNELVGGKPLNARGLARRLGEYGVRSKNVRTGDAVTKGYDREDLWDAWSRYLPPLGSPPKESATSATDNAVETPDSMGNRTDVADVADVGRGGPGLYPVGDAGDDRWTA